MILKHDDGKIKSHVEDFYDDDGKDKGYKFMSENLYLFLAEEIESIALHNIMLLKADIYAKATYCGSDIKKLLPLYESAIETLVKIAKTGENLWSEVIIDWKAVEALGIPDYKPFKITSYQI